MKINREIVTNVNFGYLPLLHNFRYFLKKAGLLKHLHIFAFGERCSDALRRLGIQNTAIEDDGVADSVISYATDHWKRMTFCKIQTVARSMDQFGDFLYADPDIIFQRDVFSYLKALPDQFDIYAQNDYPSQPVCSGFMYIRKNECTKKVFSISWPDYKVATKVGDQMYVNKCRGSIRFYSLPQDLFLNGVWFDPHRPRYSLTNEMKKNAYIFHYNFTGDLKTKYDRMLKHNHLCPEVLKLGKSYFTGAQSSVPLGQPTSTQDAAYF